MSRSRVLQENNDFVLYENAGEVFAENDAFPVVGVADGVGQLVGDAVVVLDISGVANGVGVAFAAAPLLFISALGVADGIGSLSGDPLTLAVASGQADGVGLLGAAATFDLTLLTFDSTLLSWDSERTGVVISLLPVGGAASGFGFASGDALHIRVASGTANGFGFAFADAARRQTGTNLFFPDDPSVAPSAVLSAANATFDLTLFTFDSTLLSWDSGPSVTPSAVLSAANPSVTPSPVLSPADPLPNGPSA